MKSGKDENIALAKLIMVIKIKIVQTELDEEEYELLKELMYSKGTPINLFLKRKAQSPPLHALPLLCTLRILIQIMIT